MRLFGTPVPAPVLTAAATSAATTALSLGAVRLASLVNDRLAERRHARHHAEHEGHDGMDDSDDACDLDSGTYPDEYLVLRDIDGVSTGACIAALRERYLVDDGSVTEILANFDYIDLLRSFAETTLVLAMDLADANFEPCGCEDEDCPNQEPDPDVHPMVAGRYLLYAAQSFEARHATHARYCDVCSEAGPRARGLVRAQFCRDIADDLLCNFETDDIVVRGVPLQAGFDIVCAMLETIENITGNPIANQVEHLSKGLAAATAHASGVPFGGHAH